MTGNVNYPTPVPTLADIRTANDAYITSLARVENGSREDTVIKNTNRASLEVMLKALATYVQTASNGEEAIILSSGFDVNKKPTTVGTLSKPENITVKQGANKGSVILNCDVVDSAQFYEFEYTNFPAVTDSLWIQKTSTKRNLLVDGLTSGKQYAFRVAAAGSNPSRIWSEIITSFVL